MTNQMIILLQQIELQKAGVLKYTGRILHGINVAGEEVEIPEIQPIHTFQRWKTLGYRVKKGEKAVAKFPIWKYIYYGNKEMSEEEAQNTGHCYMKMSAFFTDEQVEPIDVEVDK